MPTTPAPPDNDTARTATPVKPTMPGWVRTLAMAGPAFVVGAWHLGPGNLTAAVQAGSQYHYTLIWVIAVSMVFMLFYVDMSVRLGLCTPVSLIASIKDLLGRRVGILAGTGVFLITVMFSVGNAVGTGLGLSIAFGGSPVVWSVLCTLAVGFILLFRNVYRAIERVLLTIVAVLAATFLGTVIIAQPSWLQALNGLVPTLPPNSQLLIVALVGTNFSIIGAFFTAYGIHERRRTKAGYRQTTLVDTIPGIVAPGIMTTLVIVVAAAVLGRAKTQADSMPALAEIFQPLAGPVGSFLFALGLSGAAFSAMTTNATAGGTMLSDACGKGASPSTRTAKTTSGIILTFGLLVTVTFQRAPVQLIVIAQALTVVVAPLLAALLLVMSNKRKLMGDLRNTWWQNVLGSLGFISVLTLAAVGVYELIS